MIGFPLLALLYHSTLYLEPAECNLLSQSVIKQCNVGDATEPQAEDGKVCEKKFVVSMTLRGGQVGL